MKILGRRQPVALLAGDMAALIVSLYVALMLRYAELPSKTLFLTHLVPFSFLFVAWLLVFYIAGLYERQTMLLRSRLPSILLNTLIANAVISIVFFYFVPFFGITPKTVLFIYLAISFISIFYWRVQGVSLLGRERRENALLIGSGEEMRELLAEINTNDLYNLHFSASADLSRADSEALVAELAEKVRDEDISVIVIDLMHDKVEPILSSLYELIFKDVRFLDLHKVYEDVFNRIPLSIIRYNWFLENISTQPRIGYDILKRVMDVLISLPLLIVSGVFFPLVAIAIKLDSPGPAFISQVRFGQGNKIIKLYKFRSMTESNSGKWQGENQITRVGAFLRKTRIDEFPQLWNVVRGDISLIGPRPDIRDLGIELQDKISYYNVRNIVRPGLSGWAQISQDVVPHSFEETQARLAYDLYYIKNRSFVLDLKIALRTIKTLLSRVGR